jgi:hypothetical protein
MAELKFKLKGVRLAFPSLFEPREFQGDGKFKYSAALLIDPADPQVATINKMIDACGEEKWGAKSAAIVKTLRATDKTFLHDGNLKSQFDGYEGMLYLSAANTLKPTVVDVDRTPLTAKDGKPYSGCYVNVVLEPWAQDNSAGRRINLTLFGCQFLRDGDRFVGGGVADESDFDDLSEGADADDLA